MTLPSVAVTAPDGPGTYDRHIPAVRELLSSLPNVQHYTTYPGGFLLKLTADHYVAALLPPTGAAEESLRRHLDDHYDGGWDLTTVEYFGQVEAWHMAPPWA